MGWMRCDVQGRTASCSSELAHLLLLRMWPFSSDFVFILFTLSLPLTFETYVLNLLDLEKKKLFGFGFGFNLSATLIK